MTAGVPMTLWTDDKTERFIVLWSRMMRFASGDIRVLVSKAKICGFGMNFQICADMVFVGMNDSFEQMFQATRRCWRYGQTRPVNVHIVYSELEGAVAANVAAKEREFEAMFEAMADHMRDLTRAAIKAQRIATTNYPAHRKMELPQWLAA